VFSITITSNKDQSYFQEVTLAERSTIGRDATCNIPLPDPDKHISRFHALIEKKDGGFYLTVTSKTNPLSVNDQIFQHGKSVMLNDGDRIAIRPYMLAVKALTKSAPLSAAPLSAKPLSPWEDPFAPAFENNDTDPFGLADLMAKPAAKPDFGPDPFAMLTPAKTGSGLVNDIAPLQPDNSLDSLGNHLLDPMVALGKRGASSPASLGGSGLGASRNSPFDDLLSPLSSPAQGNWNAGANSSSAPLVDLGGHRSGGSKSLEHVHDINLPYTPPPIPQAAPPKSTQPSANPAAARSLLDDPFADTLKTYINKLPVPPGQLPQESYQPSAPAYQPSAPAYQPSAPAYQPSAPAYQPSAPAYQPSAPAYQPSAPAYQQNHAADMLASEATKPIHNLASHATAQSADLLDAFRNTAGLGNQPMSPEEAIAYMESAGTIVRTAIEGIVSLLASRSMIKGELGAADRTMVASRDNNPLKLMPDVQDVMQFLFEKKKLNSTAYLPPVQSIAGACEDLIYHELGTAAGMRAAVEGSIRRFNPLLFEAEFDKSGKKMVLNRKASLWETYVENYSKIERDMADDIGRLFDRDFRRAYDDQIRKLKKK
jgi:FHA domain-containing protein/type VI secretion system protein